MKKFVYWLSELKPFKSKFLDFFRWLIVDIYRHFFEGGYKIFREFGVTMFCGRQGDGKTVAMVEYLERMRKRYPNVKIYTNFAYVHETAPMEGWRQLLEVRNGTDGVIFAIDEIQNEYSSAAWKDVPDALLSEITQQRKQRIKIVTTSQVFARVAKPIREQVYDVVECRTLLNRWTFCRTFDGWEYSAVCEQPDKKLKLSRKSRRSFVQHDKFRSLFDTYKKVERMQRMEFTDRAARPAR